MRRVEGNTWSDLKFTVEGTPTLQTNTGGWIEQKFGFDARKIHFSLK